MTSSFFELGGLPARPDKPRETGITLMLDKGLSSREIEDLLEVSADYIDIVKLGWGTAAVTSHLQKKLQVYASSDIPVYFGGTLFEAYYLRDQLDTYCRLLRQFDIEHVEVSSGTLDIPHEEKLACIEDLAQDFTVLSEVGSKDLETIMPPYQWVQRIKRELEAGSWKVICEARESGRAGVFRPSGEIRSGLIDEILSGVPSTNLIFEAPKKSQQVWFLKYIDPNVNLGNIAPDATLPLETLRLGLRGDTLLAFLEFDESRPVEAGPSVSPPEA
jgi:phosphosulfolactate synthase